MTELETVKRAKMYMDKLAQGIDPISDLEMPDDAVLNNVRLARCFFYVSDLLGQVIANGGMVGGKSKRQAFTVTSDQLSRVQISREPVRISQLVEMINAVVDDSQMRKLSTTSITNWLLEKGFLEKQTLVDGKSKRVPTPNGRIIGLSTQIRQGQYGEYLAVFYSPEAQRFVLDHLAEMIH